MLDELNNELYISIVEFSTSMQNWACLYKCTDFDVMQECTGLYRILFCIALCGL